MFQLRALPLVPSFCSINDMGGLLRDMERFEEAETLLLEAASGIEKLPPAHSLRKSVLNNIVKHYDDWHASRLAARYEYDPYGNALLDPTDANESGPYAATNPYRFSTKHFDAETGLYYYGHRYLDPPLGRWTSRDPQGEESASNLHAFVGNSALNAFDPDGRLVVLLEGNRSLGSGISGERELSYIGNWIRALSRAPRLHNIFFIPGPTTLLADNSLQQEWLKATIEDYSRQRERMQNAGSK